MPRGGEPNQKAQLVKALVIGDGKCGKTDWAARAAAAGFNVLYLDGDVGAQTVANLAKDSSHPVSHEAMQRIFLLPIHDQIQSNGMGFEMSSFFRDFTTERRQLIWNDTQQRVFSRIKDGDSSPDEIWKITPSAMNEDWVLVVDSFTALAQSSLHWGAEELGIDLGEIDKAMRDKMRDIYRIVGEKLTQYLTIIRSLRCHVIVIGHPIEFTKTKKPDNVTIRNAKEQDFKILWTKMLPKSVTNNHSLTMAKFFTDIAWMEVDALGKHMIDYRPNPDYMSGSHLNARLDSREGGSFKDLVLAIGGAIPDGKQGFESVIEISQGYEAAAPKPKPVLDSQGSAPAVKGKGLNLSSMLNAQKGT